MKHIREIAVFLFLLILALAAAVRSADAASEIPVYGPAAVGFEDDDLRRETIIPAGVLVVTPEEPNRLWIGDGVTKGGLEVRAKPCVTGFVDVAVATTNLTMGLWPVTFGDWAVRGGENAFGVMRGGNYKFYITYTGETTYAKYLFGMDGDVYTFTCNSVQGAQSPPWLLMTTNLLEDFQRVETGLEYVDSVTARLVWTNDTSADTLFFRVVTDRFEEEALVATVPIKAEAGITMGTNTWTEWPDVDGKVAAALADHTNNSNNPHEVKFWQVHEADEDGMRDDFGMSFSRGDGITSLSGFGRTIEVETGTVEGDWHFDERPTLGPNGFATTNDVDAVEDRVEVLEGYHELPETMVLWWTTNLASGTTNWVPTDFPTRKLEIRLDRGGLTNVFLHIDGAHDYGREVEISILTYASADGHNVVRVVGSSIISMGNLAGTNPRLYTFAFDPISKTMRSMCVTPTISATPLSTAAHADGAANDTPTGPATVEEWLALRETPSALTSSSPSLLSLQSHRPSLFPTIAMDADFDDFDADLAAASDDPETKPEEESE